MINTNPLQNIMKPDYLYGFDIYLSYKSDEVGFLLLLRKDLTYNYSTSDFREINFTIPVNE